MLTWFVFSNLSSTASFPSPRKNQSPACKVRFCLCSPAPCALLPHATFLPSSFKARHTLSNTSPSLQGAQQRRLGEARHPPWVTRYQAVIVKRPLIDSQLMNLKPIHVTKVNSSA